MGDKPPLPVRLVGRVFFWDILLGLKVSYVVQAIQRWFGPTPYRQACWVLYPTLLNNLLTIADFWVPWLKPDVYVSGWYLAVYWICPLLWGSWLRDAHRADKQFLANPNAIPALIYLKLGGMSRTGSVMIAVLRITLMMFVSVEAFTVVWLALLGVLDWLLWLVLLANLGPPLYLYVIWVKPLPPGRGKVREWLSSFRFSAPPVPVPAEG